MSVTRKDCIMINNIIGETIIHRKFIEILTLMREDWSDCTNNDSLRETMSKAKTSKSITYLIFFLHTLSVVGFSSGVILANVDVTNNATELFFITKIESPIAINTQRTYRFILMTEFFCISMFTWSSGVMNSLMLCLVS